MRQSDTPPEPCAWCGGAGTRTAVENFLLARLKGERDRLSSHWIGITSNAMLAAAIEGHANVSHPWGGPADGWDLGRCMVTRDVAPPELQPLMDKMIARWVRQMNKSKRESGSPYYGVADARKMREESVPLVRAYLEAAS